MFDLLASISPNASGLQLSLVPISRGNEWQWSLIKHCPAHFICSERYMSVPLTRFQFGFEFSELMMLSLNVTGLLLASDVVDIVHQGWVGRHLHHLVILKSSHIEPCLIYWSVYWWYMFMTKVLHNSCSVVSVLYTAVVWSCLFYTQQLFGHVCLVCAGGDVCCQLRLPVETTGCFMFPCICLRPQPWWPAGKAPRLVLRGSWFKSFLSHSQWQWIRYSSDCPACRLAQGHCWDWLAYCQYTLIWQDGKFDLNFPSQCGSMRNFLHLSWRQKLHVAWM